jgi:hypothetical protein
MNKWQNIRSADSFQTHLQSVTLKSYHNQCLRTLHFLLAPSTNYTKWQHNGTVSVTYTKLPYRNDEIWYWSRGGRLITIHILDKAEITLLHLIQNESLHKTRYKPQNTDLMMLFTFYSYISSYIAHVIKYKMK